MVSLMSGIVYGNGVHLRLGMQPQQRQPQLLTLVRDVISGKLSPMNYFMLAGLFQ